MGVIDFEFSDSDIIERRYEISPEIISTYNLNNGRGRYDGHTWAGLPDDVLAYSVPQEARDLADGAFADLAEKLQADVRLHPEYNRDSGTRIAANRLIDAYRGQEDVWTRIRRQPAPSKRITIVIDSEGGVKDSPEKSQSRTTFALGLTLALEAAGVQVRVICPFFCSNRKGEDDYHRPWIGRFKAARVIYEVKAYEEPFIASRFGILQDTGAKRITTALIHHVAKFNSGKSWNTYVFTANWPDIDELCQDADQVIWVGGSLKLALNDNSRLLQCYVNWNSQVQPAAEKLTAWLTDPEGEAEREREELERRREESRLFWERWEAERAANPQPDPEPEPEKPVKVKRVKFEKPDTSEFGEI